MLADRNDIKSKIENAQVDSKGNETETIGGGVLEQANLPKLVPDLIMLQAYFDGVADEATTKAVETELNDPESRLLKGLAEVFGPKPGDPLDSEGIETVTVDDGTLDQASLPRSRLHSERFVRGLASVDEAMCAEIEAEILRREASGEEIDPSRFRKEGVDPLGIDWAWAGKSIEEP